MFYFYCELDVSLGLNLCLVAKSIQITIDTVLAVNHSCKHVTGIICIWLIDFQNYVVAGGQEFKLKSSASHTETEDVTYDREAAE